jgi:hypothetical protein
MAAGRFSTVGTVTRGLTTADPRLGGVSSPGTPTAPGPGDRGPSGGDGRPGQSSSRTVAFAVPPPSHIVCRP